MKGFAIFLYLFYFSCTGKQRQDKNPILIWLILSATILCTNGRRIKRESGGFESALGLYLQANG
jgi:hypothetical protein